MIFIRAARDATASQPDCLVALSHVIAIIQKGDDAYATLVTAEQRYTPSGSPMGSVDYTAIGMTMSQLEDQLATVDTGFGRVIVIG